MGSESPTECVVSGALACALRMSRAAGIAPLQLDRVRTGWRARLSLPASVYGQLLALTTSGIGLVVFIFDCCIASDKPFKINKITGRGDFMEMVVMVAVALTTTITGTMRMKNMMVYLNQIHEINLELNSYGCTSTDDKKCWLLLILAMIGGSLVIALDCVVFVQNIISHNKEVLLFTMHLCYSLLFIMLLLMQIQFALIVMTALSVLKRLNDCLKYLHREIKAQDATNTATKLPRETYEAVHHLAILHGGMCDVVRLVDKSHGPMLLTLLLSYLLRLVITLYIIINFFLIGNGLTVTIIVIYCFSGIFQISSLIMVVEPCHGTEEEMENTREIVKHMTQRVVSPAEPLAVVLEVFYRHLSLNQVMYSPLKMFTINRALIITMFSAITTYLVIVIQI